MMFLYFFIFLCAVLVQGSHGDTDLQDRIAGGSSTAIEKHPYQVYFGFCYFNDDYVLKRSRCGGSIISPRHILTAAHCVEGALFPHVRAGSTRSNTGGTKYKVTQMVAHPQYDDDDDNVAYDVAFIVLKREIYLDGKTTQVIGLPPLGASVQPGMNVVVTGWGRTSISGPASQELMEVTVTIIPKKKCQRIWARKQSNVTSTMFCADGRLGDACHGDSGGPAVNRATGVQIGVVSWGYEYCKTSHFPGVYADVTNHEIRQWINRTIGV